MAHREQVAQNRGICIALSVVTAKVTFRAKRNRAFLVSVLHMKTQNLFTK